MKEQDKRDLEKAKENMDKKVERLSKINNPHLVHTTNINDLRDANLITHIELRGLGNLLMKKGFITKDELKFECTLVNNEVKEKQKFMNDLEKGV